MGGQSCTEGRGFNSEHMDIFSHLLVVSQCLFEKTKISKKAHFLKKLQVTQFRPFE